ncbi:hypothetical protein ACIPJS_14515 [Streptomyces sp. NPDC086783]
MSEFIRALSGRPVPRRRLFPFRVEPAGAVWCIIDGEEPRVVY